MFRKGPQHTATNPASRHLQTSQVLVLTFVPHAIPLLGSFFILLDGKSTRRFLFVVFSNSYQSSIEAFIGFSVLVHTFVPHAIPLLGSLLIILDGNRGTTSSSFLKKCNSNTHALSVFAQSRQEVSVWLNVSSQVNYEIPS